MNFVHSKSQECTKSELDLFSVPPTQVSLEKGHWIDHQPVSSVSDGGPITFLSPGTEDYVDLSKTILVVRAIFCDVFRSERLPLSYVDLKVILNRNVNEFCLMASKADADYRVKLTEAYLKIRKVKVSPSISIAHELALKKGPAISH